MCFLLCLYVEVAKKLQILKLSFIFSNFFAKFLRSYSKDILKFGQMNWNLCHLSEEQDFELSLAPESR